MINNYKTIINKLLIKSIICILLFLIFLICNKKINNFNSLFYKKIYNNNISFAKINRWYESHFGNIFPIKTLDEVQVFNESIIYNKIEKYYEGVKLTVNDNYIVPSITSGIIIFIGEKDFFGKTIIIEDANGLDIWYSNINFNNINIYDYVNKGDYLGEANNNNVLLKFQKNGEIEDYNKYI